MRVRLLAEHLPAQPTGDFWISTAFHTDQPPVSDELTLLCQLILKRFFFCTVSGTLFLARQKENVGDIPRDKAAFLAATAIFYKIKISRPLFAPQYQ
jgi:hypothetical protein